MTLLTAHVLNGQIVGTELTHYSVITEPFKIENSPSLGYVDISSVANWWKFGQDLNRDYSFVRKEVKLLIAQKGIDACISTISDPPVGASDGDQHYIDPVGTATGSWAGYEGWVGTFDFAEDQWVIEPPHWVGYRLCNTEEKFIAANYKIGSQADHYADYGVPTIVDYGEEYHLQSIFARQRRMRRATVEVYNRLPANVAEVLQNMEASPLGNMYNRYIEFGVKGTVEDYNVDFNPTPTPGIADWIMGRSVFSNVEPYSSAGYPTGLKLKTGWSPIDAADLDAFCDEMYDIIVNGVW